MSPALRLALGAAMISFSPVFVANTTVAPVVSAFYRVFFGSVIMGGMLLLTRQRLGMSRPFLAAVVAAGVCFALDLIFWHSSIHYVGPGLSTLLANFQVIALTLIGIIFFRERPRLLAILAVPLALLGLYLIFAAKPLSDARSAGIVFGLLTALSYAGYILCLRRARQFEPQGISPLRTMAQVTMMTTLCIGLFAMSQGISLVAGSRDLGWMFLNGLVGQTIGWLLITSSLNHLPASRIALILLLQPVLSYCWDVLFFDNRLETQEVIGAALALCAIYFGAAHSTKPTRAKR